jgi:hypothetical protein
VAKTWPPCATWGRGRGVRGRWRFSRNNTTVRGELWRVLSYKCLLLGIRARQVEPHGTTHTCPHCHQPARTFASPALADRKQALKWEPWLCCEDPECLWNGARDYAASLNIARLGLALFLTARRRTPSQPNTPLFSERQASLVQQGWRDAVVAVAGDHTPPQRGQTRLLCRLVLFASRGGTSRPTGVVAVLSTTHLRKHVLEQQVLRA